MSLEIGEAALPLHYFRIICQRNIKVWLIHERREELSVFSDKSDRVCFISNTFIHRFLLHQIYVTKWVKLLIYMASSILIEKKVDTMLEIYRDTIAEYKTIGQKWKFMLSKIYVIKFL